MTTTSQLPGLFSHRSVDQADGRVELQGRALNFRFPHFFAPGINSEYFPFWAHEQVPPTKNDGHRHRTNSNNIMVALPMVADDKILTPFNTEKTKFNYGPASYRDDIVVTCERPGPDILAGNTKIPVPTEVELSSSSSWLSYMKNEKGVQHVLILFDENEMAHYESNLVDAYERVGLIAHWEPMSQPASYGRIMTILDDCLRKGERVAAHCTHGKGRSGRVAAGWLVHHYELSTKDATLETLACATAHGVSRLGSPVELVKWMNR